MTLDSCFGSHRLLVSFNAFNLHDEINNKHVDVQAEHYKVVRDIGAASAILLKNVKNALPLKKPKSVVLIGNDAGPALHGPNGIGDRGGDDGILGMGWGSGTTEFPYLISPLEAIQSRARQDRSIVSWWLDNFNTAGAANAAIGQDVAVCLLPPSAISCQCCSLTYPSLCLSMLIPAKATSQSMAMRATARISHCGKMVKT